MTTQIIALTGGIGSGKSRVLKWLAEQGIPTLNADQIAREVVAPQTEGLQAIVEKFGNTILLENGELNRAALREMIFNQPEAKAWLESLLHPLIRQATQAKIEQLKQQQPEYIVIEIPLLAETGKPDYIDAVWVTDCNEATQIQRAAARDQRPTSEIQKILQAQASRAERLALADQVIDTEKNFESVVEQLKTML